MPKGYHNKPSKRETLKHKYKVIKKVNEHRRKLRKLAKTNPVKRKLRKEPGIPNSWPFKKELLQEIQEAKRQKVQRLRLEREEALRESLKAQQIPMEEIEKRISELQKREEADWLLGAQAPITEDGEDDVVMEGEVSLSSSLNKAKSSSKKAFKQFVDNAIGLADVVVEILDARDPESCRSLQLEDYVRNSDKKLVIALNKADLVQPLSTCQLWQKYYKTALGVPCVILRSMTQQSRSKKSKVLGVKTDIANVEKAQLSSGYNSIGFETLRGILKNIARIEKVQDSEEVEKVEDSEEEQSSPSAAAPPKFKLITVAIVGLPNVGKSSVINSLKGNSKSANTGNEAGVTKSLQTVSIDKYVRVIDTPGVIQESADNNPRSVLLGAVAHAPAHVVELALSTLIESAPEAFLAKISQRYKLNKKYSSFEDILGDIARSLHLMKRGGGADLELAARRLLKDLQDGLISYSIMPPDLRKQELELIAEIADNNL